MKKQVVYFLLMLLFVVAFVYAWITKEDYAKKNNPQNVMAVSNG